MPSAENQMYTSTRVQRATRLNGLEQARLQQRLQLLDKARLRQARLTNQDIRLTSSALGYVLNSSGHSPEADPAARVTQDLDKQQPQFFLYGERVVSRKLYRKPRLLSAATEQSSEDGLSDTKSTASDTDVGAARSLLSRPSSSPGRAWVREKAEAEQSWSKVPDADNEKYPSCGSSDSGSSTPSSYTYFNRGMLVLATKSRATPRQAWEEDVHEVTRKLLHARKRQQQDDSHLSRLYNGDPRRVQSARGLAGGLHHKLTSSYISFPCPQLSLPVLPTVCLKERSSASLVRKRPKSCSADRSCVDMAS